nr:ATP synthase F0 subunit 8 [Exilisciurus concinnus]
MPQLDTSTWFTVIASTLMTLFIFLQIKVTKHSYFPNPSPKDMALTPSKSPWQKKWTKIYLPLSLPQH